MTSTAFSLKKGLLGLLHMDPTAFAPFTTPKSLLYPKKHRLRKTAAYFKMYFGVEDGTLHETGGDLPDVHVFNYYGKKVGGVSDPGKWVAPGSSATFWAPGEHTWKHKAFQPIYTLFTANNDAICVALATITFPGLAGHYAWLGDWASECAGDNTTMATWYYGGVVIPGTNYYPNCLWIDRDGGQPATAFQVNWVDLKPGEDDGRIGEKPHDMCQTPSFNIFQSHDPVHIIYEENKTDDHGVPIEDPEEPDDHDVPGEDPEEPEDPDVPGEGSKSALANKNIRTRRSIAARAAKLRFEQKWSDVLVVDDLASHTAHTLCESPNSAGPSFVNVDHGFFCDMQTRTVHPVYEKETKHTEVCFDTEQNELVGPGLQKRSVPYQVQDWRFIGREWVDAADM